MNTTGVSNELDRVLVLEMVRVTEKAAIAASKLIGRGNAGLYFSVLQSNGAMSRVLPSLASLCVPREAITWPLSLR